MLELLDSLDDTELAEIEHNPDSMIYSPDATGPPPAALATPASPSPATAAISSYVHPADCARLVQDSRLNPSEVKRLAAAWKSGKLL